MELYYQNVKSKGYFLNLTKGKILVDKEGKYVCHILNEFCHVIWDQAIVENLKRVQFKSGIKNGNRISSRIGFNRNWRFEW